MEKVGLVIIFIITAVESYFLGNFSGYWKGRIDELKSNKK